MKKSDFSRHKESAQKSIVNGTIVMVGRDELDLNYRIKTKCIIKLSLKRISLDSRVKKSSRSKKSENFYCNIV